MSFSEVTKALAISLDTGESFEVKGVRGLSLTLKAAPCCLEKEFERKMLNLRAITGREYKVKDLQGRSPELAYADEAAGFKPSKSWAEHEAKRLSRRGSEMSREDCETIAHASFKDLEGLLE